MADGLMSLIAGHQGSDIPGALEERRQGQARDLAGEILGNTFTGKLGALAKVDPNTSLKLAEALNIPTDSKGRLNNLMGTAVAANKLVGAGMIPEAIQFINESADKVEATTGQPANHMRDIARRLQAGDPNAVNQLNQMAQAFSPKKGDPFTLSEGQTRFGPGGKEIASVEKPAEGIDQKQVNVLRSTINNNLKDFRKVDQAHKRIIAVGNSGTAAGDLALIFNYMKMLDPGSVVRESEFKTAEDARAYLARTDKEGIVLPANVLQTLQKLSTGAKLLPEQREDFLGRSNDLFGAAELSADTQIENILQQADEDNIPRQRVFGKKRLTAFEKRVLGRAEKKDKPPPPAGSAKVGRFQVEVIE